MFSCLQPVRSGKRAFRSKLETEKARSYGLLGCGHSVLLAVVVGH